MELTAQILTKNHENEIAATLQSLQALSSNIIVVDLGSTDKTISIAEELGAYVLRLPHIRNYHEARNLATKQSTTDWQLYLHPGEAIVQGFDQFKASKAAYVTVLQNNIITKEIRLWRKSSNYEFKNPIYEMLDCVTNEEIPAVIYSRTKENPDQLGQIERWKNENPTAKEPYYFQAMTLLAKQKYDEFLAVSEHYMFIENKPSVSNTMNRYYYALVQIVHKDKVKPALQNISLCLAAHPLMAEFWCLLGDVYYHLIKNFGKAKDFYEIAMILGSRRLNTDHWPMDLSKYKEYPTKMIESCNLVLSSRSFFIGS